MLILYSLYKVANDYNAQSGSYIEKKALIYWPKRVILYLT